MKEIQNIILDIEFRKVYEKILNTLGFVEKKDRKARDFLLSVIKKKKKYDINQILKKFLSLIENSSKILLFGGGPGTLSFIKIFDSNFKQINIEPNLKFLFNINNETLRRDENVLIISINGATKLLVDHNIIPNLIFSDMDGLTLDTAINSKLEETLFILHAHGDNINKIKKFKKFILKHHYIIGTTQSTSKLPIINHGGFTDGDRALFFLKNILNRSQTIYLIGYEFGTIVGAHSKPEYDENMIATPMKSKKLDFGKELTEKVLAEIRSNIVIIELDYKVNLNTNNIPNLKFLHLRF